MKPLCIDLFCGLGGWSEGFLAEGYDCIGFDIERHDYGSGGYPGQLVLQDALTIDGSMFRGATVIVASPPCQNYSYMAMPWSRAKKMAEEIRCDYMKYAELNTLFVECFRIQWEASAAAGHHIPLIVENVRGAQEWVGRSKWHYGSFHLWGDVPALMPITFRSSVKTVGHVNQRDGYSHTRHLTNRAESEGVKFSQSGDAGFDGKPRDKMFGDKGPAAFGSKSNARKAASAQIAKIPLPLSRHIARCFKPGEAK